MFTFKERLFKSYDSRGKQDGGYHLVSSGGGFFDGPKTDCENLSSKDYMNVDLLLLALGSWSGGDLTDGDPANWAALANALSSLYTNITPKPEPLVRICSELVSVESGKYIINKNKYSDGSVKYDTCPYLSRDGRCESYDIGNQTKRDIEQNVIIKHDECK